MNRPAFVAGMTWELAPLARWRAPPIAEARGAGPDAARAASERAIERGAGLLVSWGSAGALDGLRPGDLVVADAVVEIAAGNSAGADQDHECSPALADRLAAALARLGPVNRGRLCSVADPACGPAAKTELHRRSGAIAVDMESAAVAAAAARAGLAFAVVRVIVDAADQVVPSVALAGLDGPRTRPLRVAAGLLESPAQAFPLLRLAASARRARRVLAGCARRLETEFSESDDRSSDNSGAATDSRDATP